METTFVELAKQFGVWAALAIFFVWQNWVREGVLSKRLEAETEYTKKVLTETVAANTSAMRSLADSLSDRPCLLTNSEQQERKVTR